MKKPYSSYQQTIDFLEEMVGQHPHLFRLTSIGETWEKRPIIMVTVSLDVEFADKKPAVLYTGTIHAREWIGNELAIKFIEYVADNYKVNPKLRKALTHNTFYIVPCLNPDGFEYSRTHFSFWRKNRRDNGDGTFGVDLNRNFGIGFRKNGDTSWNTYGGPSAFSEPETQAVRDFVLTHKNITVSLDYHSQGNVFFPAHKFNHESEIEGTDLNMLCANMNREIYKVTGRKYGIHRGKPPANLIHGSGREYYYSLGILATVVEVGTRNIPDYLVNMTQSVDENIPALVYAMSEAINYSPAAPKRVDDFTIDSIGAQELTLSWNYDLAEDVFFEIYRSEASKVACTDDNLVAVTRNLSFTDKQLKSGHYYYYNIRAVDRVSQIKSPYAPEIRLKTKLADDQFSRIVFPLKNNVGYVGQYTLENNRAHFGYNSLFVGVNKRKGVCYGVMAFDLSKIPENAKLRSAKLSIYPMNRVNAKVENFGEWTFSILDAESINDIADFNQIHQAEALETLGQSIPSDQLTQGIWTDLTLNIAERAEIKKAIKQGTLLLRIEGPRKLPLGADSQMMQFDIGYGKFGAGIHYRPSIEVTYTLPHEEIVLEPTHVNTVSASSVEPDVLRSGFDKDGQFVYGQMAFDLSALPPLDKTVITEAYLELNNKNSLKNKYDVRFAIEQVELEELDYDSVRSREKKNFIGYELGNSELKSTDAHHFIFDSHAKQQLEELREQDALSYFMIRPTIASEEHNVEVDWYELGHAKACKLVIKYIERRKNALSSPTNFKAIYEKGRVKLTWANPADADSVGAFVVRNRFHPPKSPWDGVKLYAGQDEYTYDSFGNPNIPKYYSVFSYDDVPNYSVPESILFSSKEYIPVVEEEYEAQDEDEIIDIES